ncbi:MAG: SDR family NAD(P)-dependent oxidoreductase [Bacteroidales bacterium]|nr:SDR family NAD(P)-dependent oxidoreductase [Bacteroidales bacterium]
MNNNKTRKTALITGATKGIGYELTKLFAGDSYNLVLVARNKVRLEEMQEDLNKKHNINVTIIAKDLSVPNAALEIFRETIKKQIVVDVLVNNAGIGDFGLFNNKKLLKLSQIMQINIVSLTELTKFYLKGMVYRKEIFSKNLNMTENAASKEISNYLNSN